MNIHSRIEKLSEVLFRFCIVKTASDWVMIHITGRYYLTFIMKWYNALLADLIPYTA